MRTARWTVSHDVGNAAATSCHDRRLAHPARNQAVGIGQSVLAGGPREGLDPHAAAWAGHAAHRVEEGHGDVPQGHEVEAPDRLRVVARGPALALRAPRAGPGAGPYPDLDAQPRVLHQPHRRKEIVQLLAAARTLARTSNSPLCPENMRLAIVLLSTTGLRRGELKRLTVGDYDPPQSTLAIRPNSGRCPICGGWRSAGTAG